MKTLTIKDLARSEVLAHSAMAAVRGGYSASMCAPSYSLCPPSYSLCPSPQQYPSGDSSIHATQDLAQFQNVVNATANDSAFLSGVHATNTTSQFGQNNIVVGR
jgi:hypothetical protein